MLEHSPRLIFAALRGGSGKTTVTMGVIAALRRRGTDVAPFKKGPDFIDPGWLSLAAGRPCYNLDPFLMGGDACFLSVRRRAHGCMSIIEGNRGLFDGMDEDGTFSTAELAKLIQAPVVIVVDCSMATRTIAAMVLGCLHFDPLLSIRGVILNRIAGTRHGALVLRTVEHYTGLPVLGVLRRVADGFLPERHMGLISPSEYVDRERAVTLAREMVEDNVDLERLQAVAFSAPRMLNSEVSAEVEPVETSCVPVRIGVVRDRAFWFYYPENLEALQRAGAVLTDVSALERPPTGPIDALYVGGGFPETHARAISGNRGFLNWLRDLAEDGLPIYAECGGLMLLGEAIETTDGLFPMAGIFPIRFIMDKKPQGHGYSLLFADRDNPFFRAGTCLRGHEFHYSKAVPTGANVETGFRLDRGVGAFDRRDGLMYRNVLALYSHIHAAGVHEWGTALVEKAAEYSLQRRQGRDVACMSLWAGSARHL